MPWRVAGLLGLRAEKAGFVDAVRRGRWAFEAWAARPVVGEAVRWKA